MAKSSGLVSLFILLFVLLIAAGVGFVVYQVVNDVAEQTKKKMEKKNISVGRDGMKVGLKDVSSEQVSDSTQNVLVKVWNHSSFPGYKSRLGWNQPKPNKA